MTASSNTLKLSSSYNKGNGGEPEYSTFIKRKNTEATHTIDYIFWKGDGWRASKLLSIPNDGIVHQIILVLWLSYVGHEKYRLGICCCCYDKRNMFHASSGDYSQTNSHEKCILLVI